MYLNIQKMDARKFAKLFNVFLTTNRTGEINAWAIEPHFEEDVWTFKGNEYDNCDVCEVTTFVNSYTRDFKDSLIRP